MPFTFIISITDMNGMRNGLIGRKPRNEQTMTIFTSSAGQLDQADAQDFCARCSQPIASNAQWADAQSYCGACALYLATHGVRLHASRIQDLFWTAADKVWPDLRAEDWLFEEYPVLLSGRNFRADFVTYSLLPWPKVAIELDSFMHHSSSQAITRDRRRQRLFQKDGWLVVRFSGSEIWHDADGCVQELLDILSREISETEGWAA